MQACPGTYYVLVVENTDLRKIVACGTLVVEQKFIHEAALVRSSYSQIPEKYTHLHADILPYHYYSLRVVHVKLINISPFTLKKDPVTVNSVYFARHSVAPLVKLMSFVTCSSLESVLYDVK